MSTLFDQADRATILRRLDALVPNRPPGWGKLTAPEMVCHVSAGLRHGLGELDGGNPSGGACFSTVTSTITSRSSTFDETVTTR